MSRSQELPQEVRGFLERGAKELSLKKKCPICKKKSEFERASIVEPRVIPGTSQFVLGAPTISFSIDVLPLPVLFCKKCHYCILEHGSFEEQVLKAHAQIQHVSTMAKLGLLQSAQPQQTKTHAQIQDENVEGIEVRPSGLIVPKK